MTIFMTRLVFLLTLAGLCAQAQDRARLDTIVQDFASRKQFMGSVLVARGNEVLLSKGYGFANMEWDIPNAPAVKFRLGSITKQFTAASILLLEERGKLSISDPIKKYVPDAPAAWDAITIYHLLTHTSGIPSFTGFPEYKTYKLSPATPEKTLALYRDKPLEFQPGEKWNYSNSGYVLLGYLIEKISGQSYEEFLRENIFVPLGMTSSGVDSNAAIIPRRASGYSPSPNGIVNAEFIDMSVPHAAGALYSTTEDLLRWNQGLFGGKLLKPESLAKMTAPFKNDYALGLVVRIVEGRKRISHGGGIEGFNTDLSYYPDERLTVVVLGNLNGPAADNISRLLGAAAHGDTVTLTSERKEVSVSPEILRDYAGTYELNPNFSITITLEENQLMAQATKQPKFPLFAESESRFFYKAVDAQLEFFRDSDGTVTHLVLYQNGGEMKGVRH
jgi:CubicO group peptidase (beta-lactamase class C family)